MKTIQKLEVCFGLATFVIALSNFFFFVIPSSKNIIDVSMQRYLFECFVFLVLPELLIAVGAYLHAVKQSNIGLVLLLIVGSILVLFYGYLLVTGIAFYGTSSLVKVFLGLLPSLFAAITIPLALRSRNYSLLSK